MSAPHSSCKAFLAIVEPATPAWRNLRPAPAVRSLDEVAEHIALSEEFIAQAVLKALDAPPDAGKVKQAAGKDQMIL